MFNNSHTSKSPSFFCILVIVLDFLIFTIFPLTAQGAQQIKTTQNTTQNKQINKAIFLPTLAGTGQTYGNSACFDDYHFNSVKIDLFSTNDHFYSGTSFSIAATLENTNKYPLTNGSLFIRVFKKQTDDVKNYSNGPFIVDEFIAKDKIALDGNSKKKISFDWKIPAWATSGQYQIAAYFYDNDRYNFSGLSFTDDITGAIFNFDVKGEQTKSIYFDKNHILLNGSNYKVIGFIPHINATTTAQISIPVVNDTANDVQVTVLWTEYKWDGALADNIIEKKSQTVFVSAHKQANATLDTSNTQFPVYYVRAQLTNGDSKSIVHIRFTRDGIAQARINFPAITEFPLRKNTQIHAFACFHAMTQTAVDDGEVIVTIKSVGKILQQFQYKGPISGSMSAISKDFVSKADYDQITVLAQLYQGGVLVDQDTITYDCSLINESKCKAPNSYGYLTIIILIALLVLIFILFFIRKTIHHENQL